MLSCDFAVGEVGVERERINHSAAELAPQSFHLAEVARGARSSAAGGWHTAAMIALTVAPAVRQSRRRVGDGLLL